MTTPIQLAPHDSRYLGVAADGGGNIFMIYTEGPDYHGYVLQIWPDGHHEVIHTISGDKQGACDILVVGANLRIFVADRQHPGDPGFPPEMYDLPNVCVPLGSQANAVVAPAPSAVIAVDAEARSAAADARRTAQAALSAAQGAQHTAAAAQGQSHDSAAVTALLGGQLPEPVVKAIVDVLWNSQQFEDRIYNWLRDPASGIAGAVREIVAEQLAAHPSAPHTP